MKGSFKNMLSGKMISIISLAIIILAGSVATQLVTSQPEFCNSCHPVSFKENSCTGSGCHTLNDPGEDDD